MTQDELIAAIEKMSVLELSQLVKALEVKFGVERGCADDDGRCGHVGRGRSPGRGRGCRGAD